MINKLDKEAASFENLKLFEDATECWVEYVFNEDAQKWMTGKAVYNRKEGENTEEKRK